MVPIPLPWNQVRSFHHLRAIWTTVSQRRINKKHSMNKSFNIKYQNNSSQLTSRSYNPGDKSPYCPSPDMLEAAFALRRLSPFTHKYDVAVNPSRSSPLRSVSQAIIRCTCQSKKYIFSDCLEKETPREWVTAPVASLRRRLPLCVWDPQPRSAARLYCEGEATANQSTDLTASTTPSPTLTPLSSFQFHFSLISSLNYPSSYICIISPYRRRGDSGWNGNTGSRRDGGFSTDLQYIVYFSFKFLFSHIYVNWGSAIQ